MDSLPVIVDAVKTLGFPAAVAGFVLWRVDKTLRDLIVELRAFREVMVETTTGLEKHITERADYVVREVAHLRK